MIPPFELGEEVKRLTPGVGALRRELHRHPGPTFEEVETAATIVAASGGTLSLALDLLRGIDPTEGRESLA